MARRDGDGDIMVVEQLLQPLHAAVQHVIEHELRVAVETRADPRLSAGTDKNETLQRPSPCTTTSAMTALPAMVAMQPQHPLFALDDGGGFARIPQPVLERGWRPVLERLAALDAKQLLRLQPSDKGARLCAGTLVRPIHDLIQPPSTLSSDVRYLHLAETPHYSMGIFVFAPHAKIPLHDHPGMCVLSRILYGALDRLSLDVLVEDAAFMGNSPTTTTTSSSPCKSWLPLWLQSSPAHEQQQLPPPRPPGSLRAHHRHVDCLVAPACTALYPSAGNVHEFVAGPQGAAMLDVLVPPYDAHRDCTFYDFVVDNDGNNNEDGSGGWLVPTGQPEDFYCLHGTYHELGST